MIRVEIEDQYSGSVYFFISIDGSQAVAATSGKIAKKFNLDLDTYNDILIRKVIKHNNFVISPNGSSIFSKDVTFDLNEAPAETYIERFKNVFCEELVLLSLTEAPEGEGYLWNLK